MSETTIEIAKRAYAEKNPTAPLWEELSDAIRDNWLHSVHAVLQALMEPDNETCWAGSIALQEWHDGKHDGPNAASEACFCYMLQHILTEKGGAIES